MPSTVPESDAEPTLAPPSSPADRLGRPVEPTSPKVGPLGIALRLLVIALVMVPATAIYLLLCVLLLPSRLARIYTGNQYGKFVGRTVQLVMGIVPEIHGSKGIDELRPAIYVMNHCSTIDMWVGMWLCPYGGCGVGKKEIVRIPVFGLAYLASGHLLLDRGNREKAISSMNTVRDLVQAKGLSMWMWPEGTRSRDGSLREFKKGFAHLALATRLPIVPVVAHNADLYWKGGTFEVRPGRLQMEILDPIPTTHWTEEGLEGHVAQVRGAMARVLEPRQAR